MAKKALQKPKCDEPQNLRVDITKLYSPADYALKMGYSRQHLYARIATGKIHPNNVYDANGTTLIYHP